MVLFVTIFLRVLCWAALNPSFPMYPRVTAISRWHYYNKSLTTPLQLYSPLTSGLIYFLNVHSLHSWACSWPFGKILHFLLPHLTFPLASMHDSFFLSSIWALKPCSYSLHNSSFRFQYRLYSFSLDIILYWPLCFPKKWWPSLSRPFWRQFSSYSEILTLSLTLFHFLQGNEQGSRCVIKLGSLTVVVNCSIINSNLMNFGILIIFSFTWGKKC